MLIRGLVLQIVEWFTDLLSGLATHELTILVQALQNKIKRCHSFTIAWSLRIANLAQVALHTLFSTLHSTYLTSMR